jgi:TolB-like protein/tetratricopeptide (TPR) repeat protein
VPLGSRALELLQLLVERQGEVISRAEIMAAVWPGTTVEDSNLPTQIAALRRVLDRQRGQGSCIQTVVGRGYRFLAPVVAADPPGPAVASRSGGAGAWWWWQHGALFGALAIFAVLIVGIVSAGWSPRLRSMAKPSLPTVAVMPFANLNDDQPQQRFADWIADDIRTEMSRDGALVLSRDRQAGQDPRAQYLLEGSVHRVGDRLRINAQLLDAETGTQVWAERFDRENADPATVEDEVTRGIVIAVNYKLVAIAGARPVAQPGAADYVLRGNAAMLGPFNLENLSAAIADFDRALALDPTSVAAKSRLASILVTRALNFHPPGFCDDAVRAAVLADEALEAAPQSAAAHVAKGQVLRWQGRWGKALRQYEAALALDHNNVVAMALVGQSRLFVGPLDEAIPPVARAIGLSPRDAIVGHWYTWMGWSYLLQGRADQAVDWLERGRDALSSISLTHSLLASAYGLAGERGRGAAELAEAQRLRPGDGHWSIAGARLRYENHQAPEIRAAWEANVIQGWRQAGLPEQ